MLELGNVEVLEYYGVELAPEGPGWKTIKCPFHEDSRASARSNGKGFVCNGCGVRGDAISLIKDREDCDYLTALSKYEEITGTECSTLRKGPVRKRVSFELSGEKRSYERDGGIFSLGSSRRSTPRKRPRFSEGSP